MFGQEPGSAPQAPAQGMDLLPQLELLGWVDITALAVLLVFFVIGLFKGLIWQTSRIAILVVSYLVAGRYGQTLGEMIARKNAEPVAPGSGTGAGTGIAAPIDTPDTTIYLAYVLLFLGVLVILSLVAMIVQKLAAKAGLGFFDRLGGGVLGVATGGCLVLFGLFVVGMFFPTSTLAQAAKNSHSWRLSQRGISSLGSVVPDELRTVLKLEPLEAPGPGDGTKGRAVGQPGQPPTPGQVPDPTKPRR